MLVSVVPAENFRSDYVDQLNLGPEVNSPVLGDEAVSFPGHVGIGQASRRGRTVAFTAGNVGVLVSARTGEDGAPDVDIASATQVAESIAVQL